MNSRSSIDSTQSLAELDEGLAIPQFRLPEQQQLLFILGRLRGLLNELPEQTPCLQCGDVTANLVLAHISHEEFHCTVPVSICSTCSKKSPCAKTEINEQLWWSVLLGGFAVAFGLGQQWLLCILAAAGVAVVRVRIKPPLRLSDSERSQKIRELLSNVPYLRTLLELEPKATAVIPSRDSDVLRPVAVPLGILDQSLIIHGNVQFLCSFNDLNRANVHPELLAHLDEDVLFPFDFKLNSAL